MLSANGIRTSENWHDARAAFEAPPRSTPAYFLHEGGAFEFNDLVECYFNAIGGHRRLDLKVTPLDAEHSTDVPLLRLFAKHRSRVADPMKATIQVIGAPVQTAWLATQLFSPDPSAGWVHHCGHPAAFNHRLHDVSSTVRRLPDWQHRNSTFLFIGTDWRAQTAFGPWLVEDLHQSMATLACADRVINTQRANASSCVVIPYRAHFLLDSAAMAFARAESARTPILRETTLVDLRKSRPFMFDEDDTRDIQFTFNGVMRNRWHGETDREVLRDMVDGVQNTSVKDMDYKSLGQREMARIGMKTAKTMLRSSFCFVPPGDTPSTRRLFDALAAGCVPIVFGHLDEIADNLPFKNTINWGDIAIFVDDLKCANDELQSVKEWLRGLVENPEKVLHFEEMRTLGRLVFAKYLSYDSDGMVDALLAEFNEHGELQL